MQICVGAEIWTFGVGLLPVVQNSIKSELLCPVSASMGLMPPQLILNSTIGKEGHAEFEEVKSWDTATATFASLWHECGMKSG